MINEVSKSLVVARKEHEKKATDHNNISRSSCLLTIVILVLDLLAVAACMALIVGSAGGFD